MSVTEHLHSLEPHAKGHPGAGLFSRKIGPLSAGAWLGIGVGGIALGLYARKHFGAPADSTATVPAAAADPTGSSDPGGISSPGIGTGSQPATQGPDPTVTVPAPGSDYYPPQADPPIPQQPTGPTEPSSAPTPPAPPVAVMPTPSPVLPRPVPAPQTKYAATRAFSTFDAATQKKLLAGQTILAGDGRHFRMVIGLDGTPHATVV